MLAGQAMRRSNERPQEDLEEVHEDLHAAGQHRDLVLGREQAVMDEQAAMEGTHMEKLGKARRIAKSKTFSASQVYSPSSV